MFADALAVDRITGSCARAFPVSRRRNRTLKDLRRAQRIAREEAAENARLLDSLRASEAGLTEKSRMLEITLENMDEGLIMVTPERLVPVLSICA